MPHSSGFTGNSAAVVGSAPAVAEPEPSALEDWNTFYNRRGRETYGSHWIDAPADHWFTKAASWFTGDRDKFKAEYETYKENYLNNLNARNEQKAAQSAQAYDEYMSNTVYSRAFADMQRAGINPYMIINSGSTPSTSAGTASKPSYNHSKPSNKQTESNRKGRDLALILLALARLMAI